MKARFCLFIAVCSVCSIKLPLGVPKFLKKALIAEEPYVSEEGVGSFSILYNVYFPLIHPESFSWQVASLVWFWWQFNNSFLLWSCINTNINCKQKKTLWALILQLYLLGCFNAWRTWYCITSIPCQCMRLWKSKGKKNACKDWFQTWLYFFFSMEKSCISSQVWWRLCCNSFDWNADLNCASQICIKPYRWGWRQSWSPDPNALLSSLKGTSSIEGTANGLYIYNNNIINWPVFSVCF